ncbi:MAG: ATP-grasp domain-containing protein [Planctomycetota bacterium]|nr:MAG: ATP-grasp domain-containing protein [Planctomycetota bacterium]
MPLGLMGQCVGEGHAHGAILAPNQQIDVGNLVAVAAERLANEHRHHNLLVRGKGFSHSKGPGTLKGGLAALGVGPPPSGRLHLPENRENTIYPPASKRRQSHLGPVGNSSGNPPMPASGALSQTTTTTELLVVGASVRAWAGSAHRAGLNVHAVDLFADRDLSAVAQAIPVDGADYPAGLVAAAARLPAAPWCYTGALENHPDLLAVMASQRRLAGNPAAAVRRVRDPHLLAGALADAGISFPETHTTPQGVLTDGSHLHKPLASAAGRAIVIWTAARARRWQTRQDNRRSVWQRRVAGRAVSAAFVIGADGAGLVGTSKQLIGRRRWHARPYAYCGSIDVPLKSLPEGIHRQWMQIGRVLAADFALCGAVGVDAIATADGRLVVVEVNPRPTASMELFERSTGRLLAAEHLAACGIACGRPPATGSHSGDLWVKGVLRVGPALQITAEITERLDELVARWSSGSWPGLADLPRTGSTVPAGGALLTVFATAGSPAAALKLLGERIGGVEHLLRRGSAER